MFIWFMNKIYLHVLYSCVLRSIVFASLFFRYHLRLRFSLPLIKITVE